ncbi:MAG TPA: acetoacetate--CoA ligase, partial [Bacteroidetes bacterium]|nr:acetoacetate--CoA ligase [Bacteroidota bacterium]
MNPRILWQPSDEFIENSHIFHFLKWLKREKGLNFEGYNELWEWSVNYYNDFWEILLEYFEVEYTGGYNKVTSGNEMPGIDWFKGISLNYSQHVFRDANDDFPAVIFGNETGTYKEISWAEVKQKVASFAAYLRSIGVEKGDRVVAFLPNVPGATVAFLAVNSIGAIWSSTSPDFGVDSVVDRFAQIEPKVLIAVDGYTYNGKRYDKTDVVKSIYDNLPSLNKLILLDYIGETEKDKIFDDYIDFHGCLNNSEAELKFEQVAFEHPIWVLYSSGTTGLPKPITHSVGGVLMEHYKYLAFHNDVHHGERFFWYSTTGWMMWNFVQASFLMGATVVLYEGSPAYPDINKLWAFAEQAKINHFGTSAPFIVACMKSGINPKKDFDLSMLRSISSTGAPLPPEGFDWIYENVKEDVWLASMSGGTDVCTAFVGGNPLWAVREGEIQCRALGAAVYAFDEQGNEIYDEVG